ncbi:MAG TPA: transglutaminase domain-containing protein, partial [Rudaea sp.]
MNRTWLSTGVTGIFRHHRLRRLRWAALAFVLGALACVPPTLAQDSAQSDAVAAIAAQIDAGQFAAAKTAIDTVLTDAKLPAATRTDLEFQRERMRRILLDFTLSRDELIARVREQIPDLTQAEFERWDAAGLFERQVVDGRVRYFHLAHRNLFRLSAQARARRANPKPFDDSPFEVAHPHHREVRDAALAEHRSGVAPRHLRVTQSLTVKPDAVPAGKTVRAWI